jgi:chemotaxis signal transduction protein
MDKSDYLVASVGDIQLAVYCRDVENVYCESVRLVKLFYQDSMFRGLISLNGRLMQVLDLRRRIGMEERLKQGVLTLISFNTGGANSIAVVVDEIVGMRRIESSDIHKNDAHYDLRAANVGLLFPTVALLSNDESINRKLIHILDSTYLDKTKPVEEDAGELELF